MTVSPWIYSRNDDNSARFLLGRFFPGGERGTLLLTVGINPSTAEPEKLDNTVSIVQNRAEALGYGGWCTINVYPQRSTDPNGMDRERNEELHRRNLEEIRLFVEGFRERGGIHIWAAWGALIRKREYLLPCLEDISCQLEPFGLDWYSIGRRTKEGHPHHPLYLKRGLIPERFDIKGYLEELHGKPDDCL